MVYRVGKCSQADLNGVFPYAWNCFRTLTGFDHPNQQIRFRPHARCRLLGIGRRMARTLVGFDGRAWRRGADRLTMAADEQEPAGRCAMGLISPTQST